jgi:hypothetical protein
MAGMTALEDAIVALNSYNSGTYNASTNPYGYSGIGGIATNWVDTLRNVATVANHVAEIGGTIFSAQSTLSMAWDTGTTDADPGAGKMRGDAVPESAAHLYISTTDSASTNVSALLTLMGASTSSDKSRARLVKVGDSAVYADFSVTSATAATSYYKIGVTYLAGAGSFSASDAVALGFVQTGDAGTNGIDGATWSSGSGAPSGGADGDLYLRTSNGDVYERSGGSWSVIANLTGPTGLTGDNKILWGGAAGGTANALTVTTGLSLSAIARGHAVAFKVGAAANTGAATIAVDSASAATLQKNGSPLVAGDLPANATMLGVVDASGYVQLVGGGFSNPMTTAGDLIVGGASGAPTRIAHPGSVGMYLKTTSATAFGWVYDLSNTVWSSTDKNAAVTISNAGRTALVTGGVSGRATTGVASGRWYWEVELNAQSLSNSFLCGVAALTAAQNDYLGVAALTWAYDGLGRKVTGGTYTAYGSSVTTGIRIGFALDMDSGGLMWVRVAGVWQGGGDPATGASPMFSGLVGTVAPAVSNNNGGSSTATTTGYFSASTWTNAAPANFRALP